MLEQERDMEDQNSVSADVIDNEDVDDVDDLDDSNPNESKNEKFQRLAIKRTNKIIKSIQILENLSNKINYSYTVDEVDQIFDAIEQELSLVKETFLQTDKRNSEFKFK